MGLLQEGLGRSGEIKTAFSGINPDHAKIQVETRFCESPQIPQKPFIEGEKEEQKRPQQHLKDRTSSFEPFVNPEPKENQLFVNSYNGNFAQQMDLNREGIEKVLKTAHLDGQVFLTSLSPNRQRSIEANPDGSVTKKRSPLFGESIGEDQKENPYYRVVSIPQGWRVEINDTRIREELEEKKLAGKKLQTEFTRHFDAQLKQGTWECIWREKLTSIKDRHLKSKLKLTLGGPLMASMISLAISTLVFKMNFNEVITASVGSVETLYILYNVTSQSTSGELRKIDHLWEFLMPQVEIDKVLRSAAFLTYKGRTLVKKAKQPKIK